MPDIDLDSLRLGTRTRLPEALRALVEAMPQAGWEAHPGFGGLTQFWLEKHAGFRQLMRRIADDCVEAGEGRMAPEVFAPGLYRLASTLLGELHGHHAIEDAHYFPQLRRLEPSVARGFDLLEADHQALDAALHGFAEAVNGVLRPAAEGRMDRGGVVSLGEAVAGFSGLLDRHLVDEEEIVIPALLRLSAG